MFRALVPALVILAGTLAHAGDLGEKGEVERVARFFEPAQAERG